MLAAGIDIGAATAKMVILRDGKQLSDIVVPTGPIVREIAMKVADISLSKCGMTLNDLDFVVSTGYGRDAVPFKNKAVTEIICHGKGAHTVVPNARTVIDIGGQDSKIIRVDAKGNVTNFAMNDKCAAGTGRFLEVMSGILDMTIEEMGLIGLMAKDPCTISSVCTVFAETEVVSLRAEGRNREDLTAGLFRAIAHRLAIMGRQMKFEKQIVLTGGVAKNEGVKRAIEKEIGFDIFVPEAPQIIGALGAALVAEEILEKGVEL